MAPAKVVLLACGSFNPPTIMHLRMFEIARDHLTRLGNCQVVGGILSPVHDSYGKKDLVSATHRCALLRLALQDTDWIQVSDWECKQQEWVRTCEVLQFHQNRLNSALQFNDSSGLKRQILEEPGWVSNIIQHCIGINHITVKVLCGADLLESFGVPGLWKENDIETIVRDHGLVVITRSGTDPYKFIYESDILTKHQNNITIVTEWITNEVSSTKIRRSLRRGESVKYLLTNAVIDYIKNNGLYSTFDNKYHLYSNGPNLYNNLTPSPNESQMLMMVGIDSPDSGNYSNSCISEAKRARLPGQAVQQINNKVTTESIDETRVEIQITKDGQIEVISDKETTV